MQRRLFNIKVLKYSLILFLTLSLLTQSFPIINKAEAAYVPSCGQVIDEIENDRDWMRLHLNEYKRITQYIIPSPLHAEYLDYWIEAAQKDLESFRKALSWLTNDIDGLFACEDNNPYWSNVTTEDLENILIDALLLFGDSIMNEVKEKDAEIHVGFNKFLNKIKLLSEERNKYADLFINVVIKDEDTRKLASHYTQNLLASLDDRITLRMTSYNKNADSELSKLANLIVVSDGVNILKGYISDFLERSANNAISDKPDSSIKLSAKSFLFDFSKSNIISMAPRAMYMTYFEQQLAVPYISASDTAFRKDLAGNLASFMVSPTDIVSFGLAYSELVLDLYDYIEKELAAVVDIANASLKDYKHAEREITQKMQTLEHVNTFATKIHKIYFVNEHSDKQLKEEVQLAYNELEADIKNVYKLDPNAIKLYINGKPIVMPQPAYITSGTTMVPLRVISEELGVKPIWNGKAQTITFTTSKSPMSPIKPIDIILTVGSKRVAVGSFTEYVTVAPTIKNGTTFVPLAFIANHLGLDSTWEAGSKSVILKSRGK